MVNYGTDYRMVFDENGKSVSSLLAESASDLVARGVNIKTPFGTSLTSAKGDGTTDDTTAIQAIIDYVYGLGGGSVVIPLGTFIFTQIIVKQGVRLVGVGGTLKLKDNTCNNSATSYYPINNMNGSSWYNDVKLIDLIVDGNQANNTLYTVADSITVGGDNITVTGCKIINSVDSAIMFSKVSNSNCSFNRIDGTRDCGIYVNASGATDFHENTIIGNRITNCTTSAIALKRITQWVTVALNLIQNCGNGITLEQASTTTDYSLNMTIVNNRMRNIGINFPSAAGLGINIREGDNTICIGNRVEEFSGCGIKIEGTTGAIVMANHVSTSTNPSIASTMIGGIVMVERTRACFDNIVIGNTAYMPNVTNARAIFLANLSGLTHNYNKINENKAISGFVGMRVESTWINNDISSNSLKGTTYDVEMVTGASNRFFNNRLVNNLVSGVLTDYNTSRVYLGKYALWIDSTGKLRVKSGSPTSDTDGTVFNFLAQSSAETAINTGDTITTSGVTSARVAPTASVTGVILQSGTFGGQEITVVNHSAFTVAFSSSNMVDSANATINANSAKKFVWAAGTAAWFHM